MKQSGKRGGRAALIALFLALLLFAGAVIWLAVRVAYRRYTGDFGRGSFAGLSSLPAPIICLLLGAPLLGFLFATGLTFRAIRRAEKKEEAERENDPERDDEYSDF